MQFKGWHLALCCRQFCFCFLFVCFLTELDTKVAFCAHYAVHGQSFFSPTEGSSHVGQRRTPLLLPLKVHAAVDVISCASLIRAGPQRVLRV